MDGIHDRAEQHDANGHIELPAHPSSLSLLPFIGNSRMKLAPFRTAIAALCAILFSTTLAFAQASQVPLGEQCFQGTAGINGFVGATAITTAGTGGTSGTYGGVALT